MTRTCHYIAALAALAGLLSVASFASAQTAPNLGTARAFAVLGASTVTNTGNSVITGNLGVSPGAAVTGFPPGVVVAPGVIHAANAAALSAQNDTTLAYNNLAGQACTTTYVVPTDIGGSTLAPGVYCFNSTAAITGTVTLNGGGNANAVWVFKIASTLTTAAASSVSLTNSAQACNVFWQVGSSATLGTTTAFNGSILAQASITLTTGATMTGRALARTGAVTLDTNTVTRAVCAGAPGSPGVCSAVEIAPATVPAGTTNVAYSQTLTGSGGNAPYVFTITDGALPTGLSMAATGEITGTPTGNGTYDFTVRATDVDLCWVERRYGLTVNPVAVPTLPQVFAVLLALGLMAIGYAQVRRRRAAG